MKIAVLDISSKNAVQYNPSLCKALGEEGCQVILIAPTLKGCHKDFAYFRLLSLVPQSWVSKDFKLKKVLRAIEVILNYVVIAFYILIKRPDILHVQWLPLTEVSSIEYYVLALYKNLCPKMRVFLTAHNVYPHNSNVVRKALYKERFLKVDKVIDGYMVHLNSSKVMMQKEFGISEDRLHVAYHGLYIPDGYTPNDHISEKVNIILYGYQTLYKGADLLVDAVGMLSNEMRDRISVNIIGSTDSKLYALYSEKASRLGINWINRFVTDEELYTAIGSSDLILLPYRNISQSGVLLLALSYRKPILTSDLPSFKETLEGYPNDYFFKTEDPKSLSEMIERFISGQIDKNRIKSIITELNKKYAWTETAKATIKAYKSR